MLLHVVVTSLKIRGRKVQVSFPEELAKVSILSFLSQ